MLRVIWRPTRVAMERNQLLTLRERIDATGRDTLGGSQ
jgi:hypothetical protein